MNTLKKIIRILLKSIGYMLLLMVTYVVIGFVLSKITVNKLQTDVNQVTIYIKSNGVHTDIVLPIKSKLIDWSELLPYSHIEAANNTFYYVGIGWGDKGFYLETPTWADLKLSTALKAATGLSTTAMHTTYYTSINVSEQCKEIQISWEEYALLIAYIKKSFQQDSQGNFIAIDTDANYGVSDAFYEGNGSYSVFTTCNTWTNSALKAANQKACLWTALDRFILEKYE